MTNTTITIDLPSGTKLELSINDAKAVQIALNSIFNNYAPATYPYPLSPSYPSTGDRPWWLTAPTCVYTTTCAVPSISASEPDWDKNPPIIFS